jgi:hypothetical protein
MKKDLGTQMYVFSLSIFTKSMENSTIRVLLFFFVPGIFSIYYKTIQQPSLVENNSPWKFSSCIQFYESQFRKSKYNSRL